MPALAQQMLRPGRGVCTRPAWALRSTRQGLGSCLPLHAVSQQLPSLGFALITLLGRTDSLGTRVFCHLQAWENVKSKVPGKLLPCRATNWLYDDFTRRACKGNCLPPVFVAGPLACSLPTTSALPVFQLCCRYHGAQGHPRQRCHPPDHSPHHTHHLLTREKAGKGAGSSAILRWHPDCMFMYNMPQHSALHMLQLG